MVPKFMGRSLLARSQYSVRVGVSKKVFNHDSSGLENEINNFIKGLRG